MSGRTDEELLGAIADFGHFVDGDKHFADCLVECVVWHYGGRACFDPEQDWKTLNGNAGIITLNEILAQAQEKFGGVRLIRALVKSGTYGWLYQWGDEEKWVLDGITTGWGT